MFLFWTAWWSTRCRVFKTILQVKRNSEDWGLIYFTYTNVQIKIKCRSTATPPPSLSFQGSCQYCSFYTTCNTHQMSQDTTAANEQNNLLSCFTSCSKFLYFLHESCFCLIKYIVRQHLIFYLSFLTTCKTNKHLFPAECSNDNSL